MSSAILRLAEQQLPSTLFHAFKPAWENFCARCDDAEQVFVHERVWQTLPKVWACSPFVARLCQQNSDLFLALLRTQDLEHAYEPDELLHQAHSELNMQADESEFMRQLRLFRNREMLRIAWRDLAGWADLSESLRDLSGLADAAIQVTVAYLRESLQARFGLPMNAQQQEQPLAIMAMGKLGGEELNFSSDIDLILCYPEEGMTQGGRKSLTNQEYFVRIGQKIGQILSAVTPDGFVFRVDLRLRPFGDSGPLAMNFDAVEEYYQAHAREWERYALVKARIICTDSAVAAELWEMLKPFVFRRYLDYGTFEALRQLKSQIDHEVRRKGFESNIKLGPGGIREVEFICQAFQLLRGGRQPALQVRHLLSALTQLQEQQVLSADVVTQLRQAYCFLRLAENRLQAIDDRQTQLLPENETDQLRLSLAMGFASWTEFMQALQQQQCIVSQYFKEVIVGEADQEHASSKLSASEQRLRLLWEKVLPENDRALGQEILQETGFNESEEAFDLLKKLQDSSAVRHSSKQGQERLASLMPILLPLVVKQTNMQQATLLKRLLELVESVVRRSVYLALLLDHSKVLKQLVYLFSSSTWLSEQITRYPLLLDELLEARQLYNVLEPEEIDNAVRAQLAHVPMDDLELQMDTLRHFKRAQMLHVAAAELSNNLCVERASDYITAVADSMLRQTLAIAWDQMVQKHGQPMCAESSGDEASMRPAGFCIVAYGKAGGIEMSHSSDLDLVFLHNSSGGWQCTDGERSIDNQVFFVRLAKRIIHLLSTQTASGVLYEVDPRLRPGGNSGLLVSSLKAFHDYQHDEAWTWEHQALVRARAVAGAPECMAFFEQVRRDILQKPRDVSQLRGEVVDMRHKMRDNLDKSNAERFDLKQGQGGITDIEFMVQYGMLRWTSEFPILLETTGMLPMLKRFVECGLLPDKACERLGEAYRLYRTETHRLALQNKKALVSNKRFVEQRRNVSRLWLKIMKDATI